MFDVAMTMASEAQHNLDLLSADAKLQGNRAASPHGLDGDLPAPTALLNCL